MSEDEVAKWIWDEEDTRVLMQSVIASKGITNRPVVQPDSSGSYVVKEGNRRIVALRRIAEAMGRDKKIDFPKALLEAVECEILPKEMPEKEIDIYLAREHVTGKRDWAALNQASHFFSLYMDHSLSYDSLADLLGISKLTAIRSVNAYKATKEYLRKHPGDKIGIRRYTYFDEFFKRKGIQDACKLDPSLLERFDDWLSNNKLADHRQVRRLPEVLNNPAALVVLEKQNMTEAIKTLESGKPPQLRDPTYALVQNTTETLQKMPRSEIKELRNDKLKLSIIRALKTELESLIEEVEEAPDKVSLSK